MNWRSLALPSRILFLFPVAGGFCAQVIGSTFGWADPKSAGPMFSGLPEFATGLVWVCVAGAPFWWSLALFAWIFELIWQRFCPSPIDVFGQPSEERCDATRSP